MTLLWVLAAGDGFEGCGDYDGVAVASRPVPGSPYVELRFTLDVRGDVQDMCTRAWGTGRVEPGEPHVRLRQVLEELKDERLTWEVLAPPVIEPRAYVLRRTRSALPSGACRVEFRSSDDAPLRDATMRLKHLAGSFVFEPRAGGLVHVEHRIHLDLGGSLSPFLVERSRKELGAQWLKRLLGLGG